MHAIVAAEEITLLELEADPQEENQVALHQEAPGEGEPKVDHLLECVNLCSYKLDGSITQPMVPPVICTEWKYQSLS